MNASSHPFESLRIPNFALYFSSQFIYNAGTWFRTLALALVLFSYTGSALSVAGMSFAQFLPMLLLGPLAGAVADRFPVLRMLITATLISIVVAIVMFLVVATQQQSQILLYSIVAMSGVVNTFERAGSQVLIYQLVDDRLLSNAVSLNTVTVSAARSVGPALAGLLFASAGASACFLVNLLAYLVVAVLLASIRSRKFFVRPMGHQTKHGIRQAWAAMVGTPGFVLLFIPTCVISLIVFNFLVTLTAFTLTTVNGSPADLGIAHSLNAAGAVVGGLAVSAWRKVSLRAYAVACLLLGITLSVTGLAPDLAVFLVLSPVLGIGIGYYQSTLYSTAQHIAPSEIRGRMMALINMAVYGLTPIGAVAAGLLIEVTSARFALELGAILCVISSVAVAMLAGRVKQIEAISTS